MLHPYSANLASSTNPKNPCKLVQYPTTNHPLDEMECLVSSPTIYKIMSTSIYHLQRAYTQDDMRKTVVSALSTTCRFSFFESILVTLETSTRDLALKSLGKKTLPEYTNNVKKKHCMFRVYRGVPAYVGILELLMVKFQGKSQWSREDSKVVVHFHPRETFGRCFFSADPQGCSLQF